MNVAYYIVLLFASLHDYFCLFDYSSPYLYFVLFSFTSYFSFACYVSCLWLGFVHVYMCINRCSLPVAGNSFMNVSNWCSRPFRCTPQCPGDLVEVSPPKKGVRQGLEGVRRVMVGVGRGTVWDKSRILG